LLEKHADDLRAIVSSKAGITLKEMRDALHARGIVVKALSTIADMLHRLDLSHKKRACERPSRIGPTWPGTGAAGGCGSVTWMLSASSSSTRPPPPQR
jgi:transposase